MLESWVKFCVCMLRIVWATKKHPYLPLCMACIKGMALVCNGENFKCWGLTINLSWPNDVIYMFIKPNKNIETFKEQKRMKVLQSFKQHNLGDYWTNYFWTYYCQFGMCSFSFSIFDNNIVLHPFKWVY